MSDNSGYTPPPSADDFVEIDYQEEFDLGQEGVNWTQIEEAIAESQEG